MKKSERLPWPKNEAGEPEEAAFLCNLMGLDLKDNIRINMLEAYGIPCFCTYPGDGTFAKIVLGMSGEGTNIFVPASRLEEARALCEDAVIDDSEEEEEQTLPISE